MKNIEDVFKHADFARGSDHKERLYGTLFEDSSTGEAFALTDNQLDMVSAGRKTEQIPPVK